jgi:hypothetical protein
MPALQMQGDIEGGGAILLESALSFAAECWYRVGLLRLLIEDLGAVLRQQGLNSMEAVDVQMIRNCELLVREHLGGSLGGVIEEVAERNRARLRVFDRRVGDGIRNPEQLDLVLLKHTLAVWQCRLLEEQPALRARLFEDLGISRAEPQRRLGMQAVGCGGGGTISGVFECWGQLVDRSVGVSELLRVVDDQFFLARLGELLIWR